MIKTLIISITAMIILTGCAGKVNYRPPSEVKKITNTKTLHLSRDEVWKKLIPSLANSFFIVNNLEKDSGFINLSYSGSPEKYIDCGYIESYVKNARGERTYNFPAATAYKEYETFVNGTQLLFIRRKMNLEGRINIILQDLGNETTLITINVKYIVTKNGTISFVQGGSQNFRDSISFNTNGFSSFPQGTTCRATGVLEKKVLMALSL